MSDNLCHCGNTGMPMWYAKMKGGYYPAGATFTFTVEKQEVLLDECHACLMAKAEAGVTGAVYDYLRADKAIGTAKVIR